MAWFKPALLFAGLTALVIGFCCVAVGVVNEVSHLMYHGFSCLVVGTLCVGVSLEE